MIFVLICSILANSYNIEQSFSFVPPYFWTNINEFDNWTMRGSAINMKYFIRLTPAIENQFGALCQRIPTLFSDWSISIQFAASFEKDKNGILKGGRGFWFHFTESPCPMVPLSFNGICIWINTTVSDSNGTFPVYFIQNNNSMISPKSYTNIGRIPITKEGIFFLKISRIQNKLFIYHDKNISQNCFSNSTQILINQTNLNGLFNFGYFTISALTTENAFANNDLIQIQTIPYSNFTNKIPTNLSQTNRKVIDNQYESRKEKKKVRLSLMKTVDKINKEIKVKNNSLTDEKQNLSSAFLILDEIKDRALSTITLNALMNFIDMMMKNQIGFAYQKLEYSTENLNSMKNEISDIWSNLKGQLMTMANDIHKEMDDLANETIGAILKLKMNQTSVKDFKLSLKKQTEEACNIFISKILLLIIVGEIVMLVIYVFILKSSFQNSGPKENKQI